jgi:hypothetical protein
MQKPKVDEFLKHPETITKENNEAKLKANKSSAQTGEQNVHEKKIQNNQHEPLMALLKKHLTNEMHGAIFISIETPHLMLKLFLIAFLLIAYSLAAYTTIKLILTYLQYDIVTKSRTIYETPSVYPKITLCNLNPFTTLSGWQHVKKYFDETNAKNSSYNARSISAFVSLLFALNSLNNETEKKSIAHNLDDILIGCKFNYQACTSADFIWEFDKIYGNCYSFNSGFDLTGKRKKKVALKTSSLAGSPYGLQLDLYVNYYENLSVFNSVQRGMGALIRIDNATQVIDHVAEGVMASTGFYTNIALGRENKFIMKKPYSDCVLDNDDASTSFDSDIYRAILASEFTYSQQFCLIQCAQKLVINTCGCHSPYFKSIFNSTKCSDLSSLFCGNNAYWYNYSTNEYVNNVCLPLCPLECNTTKFTYTTSTSKLVGNSYVDIIQNNPNLAIDFVTRPINANTVGESIAKINIFYDSLSYVNSEETPALDIITLIATMGGNWGLFLSVNLFSIAEIVTILFELRYFCCQKQTPIIPDSRRRASSKVV